MNITISSMFVALLTSTILIILLSFIFANKNSYKFFRIDFLSILLLITILRLCIPIEQFYTITIAVPLFMNPFTDFLNFQISHGITILHILLFIWLIGSLIKCRELYKQIKQTNYLYKHIEKTCIKLDIKNLVTDYSGKNFPVFQSSFVSSPMVLLSKKTIFLPSIKYTDEEIANILYHEVAHITLHDSFIKRMIQILIILYWWFPPIYKLEKQINLFLELRVDAKVSKHMKDKEREKYLLTLLSVNKKYLSFNTNFPIRYFRK